MSDYIANTKDLLKSVSHFRGYGKGENKGPLQERASPAYLPLKKEREPQGRRQCAYDEAEEPH